jgi:hypothetical protein
MGSGGMEPHENQFGGFGEAVPETCLQVHWNITPRRMIYGRQYGMAIGPWPSTCIVFHRSLLVVLVSTIPSV